MRLIFFSLLIILNVCFVINNCGERKVNSQGLITHGYQTKAGEWPFHAAIYHAKRTNSAYACGGTVISEYAILTAVHCTRDSKNTELNPEIIKVQMGKFKIWEYSADAQYHSVLQIAAHKDYEKSTHKNDIALLTLETKITYTDFIQPACLWSKDDWRINTVVGQIATVVGWGWTEDDDEQPNELRAANLPIIGDIECIGKSPTLFWNTIFEGSFCAGLTNGTSACNGDSGGGLFLKVESRWFLRGIVSFSRPSDTVTGRCDSKELVGFVNVAHYIDWITLNMETNSATTENIENSSKLVRLTINAILNDNIQEAVDTFLTISSYPFAQVIGDVYSNDIKNVPKIIDFIEALPSLQQKLNGGLALYNNMTKNNNLDTPEAAKLFKTLEVYSNSENFNTIPEELKKTTLNVLNKLRNHRISAIKCREYSEFRTVSEEENQQVPIAENPHLVALGYNNSVAVNVWFCTGFLISSNFVVTAASCINNKDRILPTVRVGDCSMLAGKRGAKPRLIGVEQVFKHPDYRHDYYSIDKYNDIALLKLNQELKLDKDIRPACLWASPIVPNVTLYASGFEKRVWSDVDDQKCWTIEMKMIKHDECEKTAENIASIKIGITNSQVCGKKLPRAGNDFLGDYGEPLQIKNSIRYEPIYNVVGVISFHLYDLKDDFGIVTVFTRVSSYVDWIESIVWGI